MKTAPEQTYRNSIQCNWSPYSTKMLTCFKTIRWSMRNTHSLRNNSQTASRLFLSVSFKMAAVGLFLLFASVSIKSDQCKFCQIYTHWIVHLLNHNYIMIYRISWQKFISVSFMVHFKSSSSSHIINIASFHRSFCWSYMNHCFLLKIILNIKYIHTSILTYPG